MWTGNNMIREANQIDQQETFQEVSPIEPQKKTLTFHEILVV